MKSHQFGYWTDEVQDEIWKRYSASKLGHKQTCKKLAAKYKKKLPEIYVVIASIRRKKMYEPTVMIIDGIKVTKYLPGYAHGAYNNMVSALGSKSKY